MADQVVSDKQLLERYSAGDELALNTLIKRYEEKIYTTIFFFVKDEQEANDLFQETFIKIIRTLRKGKYKERGKFGPWAARVAYNLCIDEFRKKKRKPSHADADITEMTSFLKIEDEQSVEDEMVRDETCRKVRDLIDELPQEQKEVVILRHYADLSFKEIANLTQVSINTALGRMRYALNNMRKIIDQKNIKFY